MSDLVREAFHDGICTITMNRPEARNALSVELITALSAALDRASREDRVRALVLAGEGKSFCAGMDLKAVQLDPVAMGGMLRMLSRVSRQLRRLMVPTVSAVQGAAIGGGCGLMVVTDFAFTHAEAKLGYPEVDLGICPAVVAPWLVRKIGAGRARAMLLAGGTMSGTEGFQAGLATHLVGLESLHQEAHAFATRLARGGPRALATTKRWLNELDGSNDDAMLDRAAELSAEVIAGDEAQERLKAAFMPTKK